MWSAVGAVFVVAVINFATGALSNLLWTVPLAALIGFASAYYLWARPSTG